MLQNVKRGGVVKYVFFYFNHFLQLEFNILS